MKKNRATKKASRRRFLGLEPLESRLVLDGGIQAFVSGGSLHITGDSQDNQILIEQHTSRTFIVSSRDGTTLINGQSDPQTFTGVGKDLDISMGDGDDIVELTGTAIDPLWVVNQLSINTGNGADQVLMTEVHALRLNVNTGAGDDTLNIGNDGADGGIIVTKEAVILTGSGQDDARIANSSFKRTLDFDLGSGNDHGTMHSVSVGKRSIVTGGSGSDQLSRLDNHGKYLFERYETFDNDVSAPAPVAPVAADDTATVATGGNTSIDVAANDTSDSSTLDLTSIAITQQPTSGSVVANSDGTVTYTNSGGAATSDSFQYTIKDQAGNVSNAATVSITVTAPAALAAVNDSGSVTEDATPNTATGNVLTNDTGGTGTKTVTAVNGTAGNVATDVAGTFGTFHINADGTFTYTLDNTNATVDALNDGQTLSDAMPYTVSAGSETSIATLTVTINGHTDPAPLAAANDTASVTEDATPDTATGNVLTNDTGGVGTKTVSAVNGASASVGTTVQGSFGTFQINADGSFTYTLDNTNATVNGLNDGQTLSDVIPYSASAGSETSIATLTVTINGHTDPTPLAAANDTASITEDATPNTATGNVLTNDTGGVAAPTVTAVNGDPAGVAADVAGTFGTFHINADGTFTYTLDNTNTTVDALNDGQSLTDAMPYTASDGSTTSTATLTVTINGHSDTALTAANDAASVTEDATPNTATGNVLTNDTGGVAAPTVTAVNGDPTGVAADVPGAFGTFHINADGSFTYTLDNTNGQVDALNDGQTLSDTMAYTAGDGSTSSTATLTITIDGHTDATPLAAVDDVGTVTEDATPNTSTGNVLNNDTGGVGAKTVTAVDGVAGNVGTNVPGSFGTFNIAADGTFTYTLDNTNATVDALNDGDTLPDAITYDVSDGVDTGTATLTITIQGHTDSP